MRRISFAITTAAVLARRKTVTRRLGWFFARPGMRLLAVDKLRTKDARRLAAIEIISVRSEPLNWITAAELEREGFAADHYFGAYGDFVAGQGYGVAGFIGMFSAVNRCAATDEITRIEYLYLDCYACGGRPTCVGAADVEKEPRPMCDVHCGHDQGDGRCWPLVLAEVPA